MILNRSQPNQSLFVIGADILSIFREQSSDFGVTELYNEVSQKSQKSQKIGISFSVFIYALDWLFVIGAIEQTETHQLRKCF